MNPGLDSDGDENSNGLSNFFDYATGAYPGLPNNPALQPSTNGNSVTFSYRPNAPDVSPIFQKSSNLLDWETMIDGVDYTVSETTPNGLNTFVTLELLAAPKDRRHLYFRQTFTAP